MSLATAEGYICSAFYEIGSNCSSVLAWTKRTDRGDLHWTNNKGKGEQIKTKQILHKIMYLSVTVSHGIHNLVETINIIIPTAPLHRQPKLWGNYII